MRDRLLLQLLDLDLGLGQGSQTGRDGDRNAVVYIHVLAIHPSFPLPALGRVVGLRVGRGGGDPESPVDGHGDGRDGSGPGGGDYGRLGVLQEPPDGLTVGLVAELPGQLEDPGRASRGHSDPPAAALNFPVPVLRRRPLRRRRRHLSRHRHDLQRLRRLFLQFHHRFVKRRRSVTFFVVSLLFFLLSGVDSQVNSSSFLLFLGFVSLNHRHFSRRRKKTQKDFEVKCEKNRISFPGKRREKVKSERKKEKRTICPCS
ncbi:hypothetical protein PanWU01x14_291240, partial [Parasponia andersonii]